MNLWPLGSLMKCSRWTLGRNWPLEMRESWPLDVEIWGQLAAVAAPLNQGKEGGTPWPGHVHTITGGGTLTHPRKRLGEDFPRHL